MVTCGTSTTVLRPPADPNVSSTRCFRLPTQFTVANARSVHERAVHQDRGGPDAPGLTAPDGSPVASLTAPSIRDLPADNLRPFNESRFAQWSEFTVGDDRYAAGPRAFAVTMSINPDLSAAVAGSTRTTWPCITPTRLRPGTVDEIIDACVEQNPTLPCLTSVTRRQVVDPGDVPDRATTARAGSSRTGRRPVAYPSPGAPGRRVPSGPLFDEVALRAERGPAPRAIDSSGLVQAPATRGSPAGPRALRPGRLASRSLAGSSTASRPSVEAASTCIAGVRIRPGPTARVPERRYRRPRPHRPSSRRQCSEPLQRPWPRTVAREQAGDREHEVVLAHGGERS